MKPLTEPDARARILLDDELQQILHGLDAHGREDFRLIVPIALVTGCRRGNAQSLQWDCIDFELNTIIFPDTKNNRPLTVPITPELAT